MADCDVSIGDGKRDLRYLALIGECGTDFEADMLPGVRIISSAVASVAEDEYSNDNCPILACFEYLL